MFKLPILEKKDTWTIHREKLLEEAIELDRAIMTENKINIAEEALDTIQVCIGILDKLSKESVDINQSVLMHEKKLINRHWKIKRILEVNIKRV